MSRVNALAKTGETHYNEQLGLLDKHCAIKGLVTIKIVPTADMSDAQHQQFEKGKMPRPKQVQLITLLE